MSFRKEITRRWAGGYQWFWVKQNYEERGEEGKGRMKTLKNRSQHHEGGIKYRILKRDSLPESFGW